MNIFVVIGGLGLFLMGMAVGGWTEAQAEKRHRRKSLSHTESQPHTAFQEGGSE